MIWRGGPIAISSGDDFPWSPFEFAVLARTATRLMARFLYGVGTADPLTFGLVSLLLIATTLTACYVRAWKARKLDPLVALRDQSLVPAYFLAF